MRYTLFALILCALSLSADRQPNVIVIFTDDQGSVDLNCYGAKDLTTPHMDSSPNAACDSRNFMLQHLSFTLARRPLTGRYPVRAVCPETPAPPKVAPDCLRTK